jgi:hypothetical protein
MEIGKFKLAKADLVRPPRKPIQEQIIPQEKPYTEDMFKEQADLYLKGFIGGFPQDEMLLKLQGILDKAVEQGIVKPEAGLNYFRNRKQELLDFAKENPGETLPSLNRNNFSDGTNPNSLKALEEINKAGALRITEKVNRFKELVKENKSPNEAKKIVMEEFNIERNPKAGTPKWMTIGKQELIDEGVKFTESKRGPESTGGKERATKKRNVVTKETQASEKRFVTTKQKMGLGKAFENAHTANIFQAKALGAGYPVDALAPQTSIQNQVYAEKLNDELKPLYKEQLKLKKAYDENPTKQITKLIDKNNTAIQNLVASGGKQGKKAANLLRGWNLDVVTGEPYLPEGGFNTLKAVDRGMTDTTLQQLKAKTPEDVVARKNYEELLKEMKGKKIPIPEKTTTRDMFKNFNARTAPKLKGVLIPGLEEIKEGLKSLPSDIAKKKYFAAGLKTLGIVATPLIAAGMYNDLSSGKSVVETLERNLIGTDIVGSTKDVLALSPEEREARSVVKQNELDKQVAQDFSDLDSDFQTPRVKSEMSLEEAAKKYEQGMSRVKTERTAQEADIARARSINVQALKDLISGERFQPQPIPQQFMANGGRIGFADGYDPKRRKFMKAAAGIASIPVFGKMLKPVVKGMEAAGPAMTQAATEAEKIFFKLVDAVKSKGIMDKLDRVTGGRLSGAYHKYKDAEVLEDAGSITAKFKTDKGAPAEIVYVKPQKRIDPKTGKEVEYPGQFDYEAQEIARINPEGDVDIDAEFEIIDSLEDVKKLIDD